MSKLMSLHARLSFIGCKATGQGDPFRSQPIARRSWIKDALRMRVPMACAKVTSSRFGFANHQLRHPGFAQIGEVFPCQTNQLTMGAGIECDFFIMGENSVSVDL